MKKKKQSKKKIKVISGIIAVMGIVSGITLMNRSPNNEEFKEIPREYFVEKGDIVAAFTGGGQIKLGGKSYNFSKPVTLEDVFVKQGQSVKAGDVLASISEASIQKKLEELNDELKKANISLEQAYNAKELSILNNNKAWSETTENSKQQFETEKASIESEIKKLEEQLSSIQTQMNDLKTQQEVLKENSDLNNAEVNETELSKIDELNSQLEDLKQQETTVRAQISDASGRLNELKGRREKELQKENSEAASNQEINNRSLAEFDHSITLAKMEVERIQKQIAEVNQLKQTKTLVAEADGIVTSVGYAANSETTVEQPVVTIGQLEHVTAEITISQSDVNKLEVGQQVHLEATAFPGEKISAKVQSINYTPIQDGSSVLYKVTVEVESQYKLLEGMTVSAKFIIKEINDILTLSNKAIEYKDGKQIVKVKREDGIVEEVEIITGFSDGRVSEIKSGLNEGDVVVVGG